ncbi:MAG: hypothetical protein RIQ81_1108 [Pseudomonadota bacterium]|jgi:hypothetical protein
MGYILVMVEFLRRIFSGSKNYNVGRLVDRRVCDGRPFGEIGAPQFDIICDIDKTYLETEFETVADLARTALEDAGDKVTVAGASDVLMAARWAAASPSPNGLHFVSSSPPQLRRKLETKLALDGLDWTSDTFKNQAYNIRKRRLGFLRHHVAYKSLAILNVVNARGAGGRYIMIGDNAESDPVVYAGVARLVKGVIDPTQFRAHLVDAGVQAEELGQIDAVAEKACGSGEVAGIFIRKVPGPRGLRPLIQLPGTWPQIHVFRNFFEVALGLLDAKVLPPSAKLMVDLAGALHNASFIPVLDLAGLLEKHGGTAEVPGVAAACRDAALLLRAKIPASV